MANAMLHVQLTITLNNSEYNWYDPQIQSQLNFDIPQELFNSASFAKAIDARIVQLEKDFPQAITDYEARQKREREKEAEAEAKRLAQAKAEAEEISERLGNIILEPS